MARFESFVRKYDLIIVCAVFLAILVLSYDRDVLSLHAAPRFLAWSDQQRYFRSSTAFFRGDLRPGEHWYPLLYPLLLAPFAALPPLVATTLVDLACFGATFIGYRAVFRRMGLSGPAIVVTFLIGTVAYPVTGDGWVMPWTTTLSAALIWGALAGCAAFVDPSERRADPREWLRLFGFAAILALIPLCRPADAIISAILLAFALPGMWSRWRVQGLVAMMATGGLVAGIGVLLHLAIHGPQLSPYMQLSAAYGANFAWLGWKMYVILIEPRPWYPYGTGYLRVMPWLPVGLAGMIVMVVSGPDRRLTAMMAIPAACYLAITLAYIDLLPSGLWKYGNSHYFKWVIPLFAGYAWLYVRNFNLRRVQSAVVLATIILAASVHMRAVPAPADAPARMLVFRAMPTRFESVYFSHAALHDDGGWLYSPYQFHAIPAADGPITVAALRRDFAGDEKWVYPAGRSPYQSVPSDNETVMPASFSSRPIARYTPRAGWGWPCWLPPYACPVTLPQSGRTRTAPTARN